MNTPTHVLMGAALFGRADQGRRTVLAALGGLTPDLPAIVLVGWARWIDATPVRDIFRTLYFSDSWQAIMAPSHAFPIWGAFLAIGLGLRSGGLTAFACGGLAHLVTDFLLHVDDAHRQFWPLSDWRFRSPVSYWDRAHYGGLFQPVELMLAFGCAGLLLVRHKSRGSRVALAAVLAIYAGQLIYFGLIFH